MAARSPVVLAPAMHTEMWEHPATRRAVAQLTTDGHHLVGPASGSLAGGDEGPGRMVEPEEILAEVVRVLGDGPLSGVRVLVTAGGTREPIDPVRYVGNRSSGRMGHAIADEASRRGADVVLVTTASLDLPRGVEVVAVETADEMAEAVWGRAGDMDVVVMAAAVADFRPKEQASTKLSRGDGPPDIVLEPTPDILGGVAEMEPLPVPGGLLRRDRVARSGGGEGEAQGERPHGGQRRHQDRVRVRIRHQRGGPDRIGRHHRALAAPDQAARLPPGCGTRWAPR